MITEWGLPLTSEEKEEGRRVMERRRGMPEQREIMRRGLEAEKVYQLIQL